MIDWSSDIPKVQALPQPYVPSVGECMSLPCVPLHNRDSSEKSRVESNDSGPSVLNYGNN